MIKIGKPALWLPNYVADTILDIDPIALKTAGITHLVFDLDNTLIQHRTNIMSPAYLRFIRSLRRTGFTILIGSNTRRDITTISRALDATAICPKGLSYKPRRSFYGRVITETGTIPPQIAMIGNHMLNDIVGANRAGLTSILVQMPGYKPSLIYRMYTQQALKRTVY